MKSTLLFLFGLLCIVSGEVYGIDYAPRRGVNGTCPTYEDVFADLQLLKPITQQIRIYNMQDCNQGNFTLRAAQQLGLKVFIGIQNAPLDIFYWNMHILYEMEQAFGVSNIITGAAVGTESLFRRDMNVTTVNQRIFEFKNFCAQNNFTFPVGYADTSEYLLGNPRLNETADLLMVNVFPYYSKTHFPNEQDTSSIDFTIKRYNDIRAAFPNQTIYIGETGWSTYNNDSGYDGITVQSWYLKQVGCRTYAQNIPVFFFEAFDQPSRIAGASNGLQEGYWGIFTDNRVPKYNFTFTCPGVVIPTTYTVSSYSHPPTVQPVSTTIAAACHTLYTSATCRTASENSTNVNASLVTSTLNYVCGQHPEYCTDINNNGQYSTCSAVQKVSYVMNQFYQQFYSQQGNAACQFGGLGTIVVDGDITSRCHQMYLGSICRTSSESPVQLNATKVASAVEYVCGNNPSFCKELSPGGAYYQCNTAQQATYAMNQFYGYYSVSQGTAACKFNGVGFLQATQIAKSSTSTTATSVQNTAVKSVSSGWKAMPAMLGLCLLLVITI